MSEMWFGEQMEGVSMILVTRLLPAEPTHVTERAIVQQVRKQQDRQSRLHLQLTLTSYMVSSN